MQKYAVDLSPLFNILVQAAGTLILAVGTWGVSRLVQWLGLRNAAQATANLDDALQKSVTYGLQQSQDLIKRKGWDDAEVQNATLAKALPYMIARFPDTLKAVGLDTSDPNSVATIVHGALDRAFPSAVMATAASPATPGPAISVANSSPAIQPRAPSLLENMAA